jgi:phenylalanyl-tRNA synthetase alpha chain
MTAALPNWDEILAAIAASKDAATIDTLEQDLFGRKQGTMTMALRSLGALPDAERRKAGEDLNQWRRKLEEEIAQARGRMMHSRDASLGSTDRFDVTLELPAKPQGHLHLIPSFIETVTEIFGRMGFDVAEGPEIETEENNFNLLNIPEDHPARDAQDTFWISGGNRTVLRTHTSPVQVRYMQSHKPPFRMICPGKVYRKDADATHSPMFHQFEGLMIGEDVSLANMKHVMVTALRELVAPDVDFRFRSGYFPFVEPGLEVDLRWRGNAESREGRWMEVVGCGMVHPNVLTNVGIDPHKWQGFAFGFGVERLLMIKHQIADLRLFYEGQPQFLRQF